MISPTILATCGLMFAVASDNPTVDSADRTFYNTALDRISHLTVEQGSGEEVKRIVTKLGAAADQDPHTWNLLVNSASEGCLKLVRE